MKEERGKESASKAMNELCSVIKKLTLHGDYNCAFEIVYESMAKYPHNPEPHNLLGILLEKGGNHLLAMKHFRIAWVLNPEYEPANQNISNFTSFRPNNRYIFDENDCQKEKKKEYTVIYDNRHIGHIIKKRNLF